jgi:hypothetical protein
MSNDPNEFLIKSLSLVRFGNGAVRYGTSSTKVRENHCKILKKLEKLLKIQKARFKMLKL